MTPEKRDGWLRTAEVVDAWRVFPRFFLTVFFLGYCWLMVESWDWYKTIDYMTIETANLAALTAFPAVLLTGIGGMFTSLIKNYQETGRNWIEHRKLNGDNEKE